MSQFDQHKGVNRRKVLECMMWIGAGVLWTISGGVADSVDLSEQATAQEVRGLRFLQISDSHLGLDLGSVTVPLRSLPSVAYRQREQRLAIIDQALKAYGADMSIDRTARSALVAGFAAASAPDVVPRGVGDDAERSGNID